MSRCHFLERFIAFRLQVKVLSIKSNKNEGFWFWSCCWTNKFQLSKLIIVAFIGMINAINRMIKKFIQLLFGLTQHSKCDIPLNDIEAAFRLFIETRFTHGKDLTLMSHDSYNISASSIDKW